MILNSKGQVFYGMHFYPGVARYDKPGKDSLTVFLNEDTIRKMGTTFAGRPVFVEHVEDVDSDLNELRKEADGWVIESFYNAADGKNWVKFIVVTDRGLSAIAHGFRLSNAYIPTQYGSDGMWNGVPYQKEILDGEFEHLAIVNNPRYEESVIMTPEEFKKYNEEKTTDLKKFANSIKENVKMKLFKRTKVENSTDIEGMMVELPKSKKEVALTKAIEEYDKMLNMNGYANGDHMVKVGNDEMSVNDLVKKHLEACNEMEKMKKENAEREEGGEPGPDDEKEKHNDSEKEQVEAGEKDLGDHGGDESLDNEEEVEEKEEKKDKKKNSYTLDEARKVLAREKNEKLKNANVRNREQDEPQVLRLSNDQVARGKQLYGSGR